MKLPFVLLTLKRDDPARLVMSHGIGKRAYHLEDLHLCVFEPPRNVPSNIWHREVIELICRIWELQYSRALLHEGCDWLRDLYARFSVKTGCPCGFTVSALMIWLKRSRSKYTDGALAVLDILKRVTGELFECSQGQSPERLFVAETSALAVTMLTDGRVLRFFSDWLMLWLYHFLVANGPNDGYPRFVLVMDDAHNSLNESNEKHAPMPLTHFYHIMRQCGLRIIAVTQSPGDLAPAVFSQSPVIIQVGGLTHEKDIRAVGGAIGMPPKDWPFLQKVKKAEFVARESLGRYDRPFGGTVKYLPPAARQFSDAQRKAIMTPFLNAIPWQPAIPLDHVEKSLASVTSGAVPARIPQGLSPEALDLARDVLRHPWDILSSRYIRLGIAGRVAQRAKQALVDAGWVREHQIPRHGRSPILLEPLAPLWTNMGQPRPSWGKGGYLHSFFQHTIAERLKRTGHARITIEHYFGTKAVDVTAVTASGDLVAFEATISLANVIDNVEKDFLCQPRFSRLTVVCLSQNDVSQAKRAIGTAPALTQYKSRISVEAIANWV